MTPEIRYHPFYCEENAWWLCAHPALGPGEHYVVFLTSRGGVCPLLHQRAAPPGRLIAWDYHVIVVDAEGRVWDLDSRLPLPSAGPSWLERTFALSERLPAVYAPRLRVIPATDYRRDFACDRSHMRDAKGRFQRPVPPWQPIGTGMNLPTYLDVEAESPGRVLTLGEARRWLEESVQERLPPSGARGV
jgi:protein N-terminal glutamine amidohydrolase